MPSDLVQGPVLPQADLSLLYLGSFLTIGLYHLALFAFRRRDRAPLYFALYCLLWAGNLLLSNSAELVVRFLSGFRDDPARDVFWMERLSLGCFVLSVPTISSFFRTLYPAEFSPRVRETTWGAAAVLTVLTPALPPEPFEAVLRAYFLFTVGVIVYALARLFQAWRRGREGALLMLLGLTVLGLAGINDMFREWVPLPTRNLVPEGLFIFILVQAAALSLRFSTAFTTVEHLSAEREGHIASLSRLDRLKDEFLANTSHELRTPLNGIIGLAEALTAGAAGPLSDQARAQLEMISGSGRRLTHLVNDILDLSRLQNRDITLHRQAVDLRALVSTVLAVSQPLVGGRRLALVNDLPAGLPRAFGDEDRLQQVLFNLVGNAVKFTDEGEITVSATAGREQLEVAVRDTGIGIPPDKLETIFGTFEQVDGSAARNYGGVGLGLGISRHLVELHGGRLWAESAPGAGSTFRFTLPVAGPAAAQAKQRDASQPTRPALQAPSPIAAPAPNSPRVLAVDDDPVNLQVVLGHLGVEGLSVTPVAGGREALALLEAGERFDLVLLDVMMPGLTGYEVCRSLRHRYNAAELPVILLTARNRVEDLTEGLASGANDYLGKPFAREELLARVNAQLRVRKAHELARENTRLQGELEARTRTELELRLTQRRLDGMLRALPDRIVAVNENREIAFCNRAFEERFGYAAEVLLGRPLAGLCTPASWAAVDGWLAAAAGDRDLPTDGSLELLAASGPPWTGPVLPAVLELEDERLLLLVLGDAPEAAPSLRRIGELTRNRRRLQQMEATLNGLTPVVLEKHPGFLDDLRAVDRSLEHLGRELTREEPAQERRRRIVETTKLSLDLWAEATQASKADLARRSGLWGVYVNQDGWERTQTLDRYLSLDTLPANPRLKTVLRTADFVLESCPDPTPRRLELATALEQLRAIT